MKKHLLISLAGLILLLTGYQDQLVAQVHEIIPYTENFIAGYVITASNDTLHGNVEYKTNTRKYYRCRIELDEKLISYYLYQVREFGFANSKHFSTRIISGKVVEVIVSGELSLFKEGNDYLLDLGKDLITLRKKEDFQSELAGIMTDYPELKDAASETKFSTASLSGLVIRYNELAGSEYKTYDLELKKGALNIGFATGASYSFLRSETKAQEFNRLNGDISGMTPSVSLLLKFELPKIWEGFFMGFEAELSKTIHNGLFSMDEPDGKHYYEAKMSATSLLMPLTLNYKIIDRKTDIFFQMGAGLQFMLQSDAYLKEEVVAGGVVESFEWDELVALKQVYYSLVGGLGLEQSIGKRTGGLRAQYILSPSFSRTEFYTTDLIRFHLSVYIYL